MDFLYYKIVTGQTSDELAERLGQMQQKGYVLYGDPFVFKDSICQAVIRQQ